MHGPAGMVRCAQFATAGPPGARRTRAPRTPGGSRLAWLNQRGRSPTGAASSASGRVGSSRRSSSPSIRMCVAAPSRDSIALRLISTTNTATAANKHSPPATQRATAYAISCHEPCHVNVARGGEGNRIIPDGAGSAIEGYIRRGDVRSEPGGTPLRSCRWSPRVGTALSA
jgi:hypothetical protein